MVKSPSNWPARALGYSLAPRNASLAFKIIRARASSQKSSTPSRVSGPLPHPASPTEVHVFAMEELRRQMMNGVEQAFPSAARHLIRFQVEAGQAEFDLEKNDRISTEHRRLQD